MVFFISTPSHPRVPPLHTCTPARLPTPPHLFASTCQAPGVVSMALDCIQNAEDSFKLLSDPPNPPLPPAPSYPLLHYFVFICICSFQCRCLAVILKCAIHE